MEQLDIDSFYALIRPLERASKTFNAGFNYLNEWLENENKNIPLGVDLIPDFQRGHVWSEQQQVKYIENVLRRIVDESGLTIRFNCPTWDKDQPEDSDLLNQMVCIDGLQRLTAMRKFIAGELKVFGLEQAQLPRKVLMRDLRLVIKIYTFQYRHELLQFYLDINGGGIAHTDSELDRVRSLLKESLDSSTP